MRKEWQSRPLEAIYPIIFMDVTVLKIRVEDVLIFAIDSLNRFNQAIQAVYPKAEIQRCIVYQIRSSLLCIVER